MPKLYTHRQLQLACRDTRHACAASINKLATSTHLMFNDKTTALCPSQAYSVVFNTTDVVPNELPAERYRVSVIPALEYSYEAVFTTSEYSAREVAQAALDAMANLLLFQHSTGITEDFSNVFTLEVWEEDMWMEAEEVEEPEDG